MPATTLHRDYETRSTLDLRKVGAWKYATHPTTDVWCCAYAVNDGPVSIWVPGDPVPPEFIEAASNAEWVVSAFNDNFERLIEQHIMAPRYGWPIIPIDRHRCTQAAALSLGLCQPGQGCGSAQPRAAQGRGWPASDAANGAAARPRAWRGSEPGLLARRSGEHQAAGRVLQARHPDRARSMSACWPPQRRRANDLATGRGDK